MGKDLIAWVDVETTGLRPDSASLLEVAIVMTDWDLNVLDSGYSAPVEYSVQTVKGLRDSANDFVKEMHDKTNLWERMSGAEAVHIDTLDSNLYHYVRNFAPEPKQARLGGNSVRLDLNFVEEYLPQFYNHLHYRFFDVSGLQAAATQWYGVPTFEKKGLHSAFDDIMESIEQARFIKGQLRHV